MKDLIKKLKFFAEKNFPIKEVTNYLNNYSPKNRELLKYCHFNNKIYTRNLVFKNKDFDLTIVSHTEPMDIGIYSRPKYYFQYQNSAFNSIINDLNVTSDTNKRYALMGAAQAILSKDAVNGFLFQLAKLGIWNKNVIGLWENSPVQANDLTGVTWKN